MPSYEFRQPAGPSLTESWDYYMDVEAMSKILWREIRALQDEEIARAPRGAAVNEITWDAIANLIGVSPQNISNWRDKKVTKISPENSKKLIKYFGARYGGKGVLEVIRIVDFLDNDDLNLLWEALQTQEG